jgi:guanylate kinase
MIGNLRYGLLFVLSAPAGTGKTTLVQRLVAQNPCLIESISHTTRQPRPGEENGVHYHFIDPAAFRAKIKQGNFLEHVELYGSLYGTSQLWVEEQRRQGKHVILVIDTQGALKLQAQGLDAVYVFVAPPSLEVLRERLEQRQTESASAIEKRLAWSISEFSAAKNYDYLIVNENLAVACETLYSIIVAEEHRARYMRHSHAVPATLLTLLPEA